MAYKGGKQDVDSVKTIDYPISLQRVNDVKEYLDTKNIHHSWQVMFEDAKHTKRFTDIPWSVLRMIVVVYHHDKGNVSSQQILDAIKTMHFEVSLNQKGANIGTNKENAEMVLNNNKQIAHHTKELASAVKGKTVPAWVVAKVNRSATDLSDVTHYIEGTEMAKNGANIKTNKMEKQIYEEKYLSPRKILVKKLVNKLGKNIINIKDNGDNVNFSKNITKGKNKWYATISVENAEKGLSQKDFSEFSNLAEKNGDMLVFSSKMETKDMLNKKLNTVYGIDNKMKRGGEVGNFYPSVSFWLKEGVSSEDWVKKNKLGDYEIEYDEGQENINGDGDRVNVWELEISKFNKLKKLNDVADTLIDNDNEMAKGGSTAYNLGLKVGSVIKKAKDLGTKGSGYTIGGL